MKRVDYYIMFSILIGFLGYMIFIYKSTDKHILGEQNKKIEKLEYTDSIQNYYISTFLKYQTDTIIIKSIKN